MAPDMLIRIRAQNDTSAAFGKVVADAKATGTALKQTSSQLGQGVHSLTGQTGNLAAQFQDIAVQLQSGQSPFTIALQQGTQVSAVLGPLGVGGAVRALGAAFMSVLSPVSLLTIGVIAIGGAAIQAFMGATSGAKSTADALKENRQRLHELLAGYDDVEKAATDAAEAALKLPEGVVKSDLEATLKAQAEAANALQLRIDGVRQSLADNQAFLESMRASGAAAGFGSDAGAQGLVDQISGLQQIAISAQSTREELAAAMTAARDLSNTADDPAIRGMADDVYQLGVALMDMKATTDSAAAGLTALKNVGPINIQIGISSRNGLEGIDAIRQLAPDLRTDYEKVDDQLAKVKQSAAGLPDALGHPMVLAAEAAAKETKATLDLQTAQQDAEKTASSYGSEQKRLAESYQTVIDSLALQTREVGMNAREQEKLNQIKAAGVDENSRQADAIRASVDALYEQKDALQAVEDEQKRSKEMVDEITAVTTSFVSTFRHDIADGKSGWEAFADAGSKAIDTVVEKILASQIANLISSLFGSGMGGGGGWNIPTSYVAGGFFPGLASGTDNWRGGTTWVGESGPELVNLPRGSQVIPNAQSMAMARGGNRAKEQAGGGGVTIHFHNVSKADIPDLERWSRQELPGKMQRAQRHPHRATL